MQDILDRAREYQKLWMKLAQGHYAAAISCERKFYIFGSISTFVSTIVASSIFATYSDSSIIEDKRIAIAVGMISLTAAALSGLQTFFRLSERAERHKRSGLAYERLRRELDLFALEFRLGNDRENAIETLTKIVDKCEAIDREAPTIPRKIFALATIKPESVADFSTTAPQANVRSSLPSN